MVTEPVKRERARSPLYLAQDARDQVSLFVQPLGTLKLAKGVNEPTAERVSVCLWSLDHQGARASLLVEAGREQ